MLVTAAYAQQAAPAAGGLDMFGMLPPILAMFFIMYWFLFRPQQKRMKQHQAMIAAVRRGDTVVTSGGFVCKVTKAVEGDPEIEVEITEGVKARLMRSMINDVRIKGEPAKAAAPTKA